MSQVFDNILLSIMLVVIFVESMGAIFCDVAPTELAVRIIRQQLPVQRIEWETIPEIIVLVSGRRRGNSRWRGSTTRIIYYTGVMPEHESTRRDAPAERG